MTALAAKLKPLVPPPVWGYLRSLSQRRHLRTFPTRIVEHRYHGQPLRVKIADGLAQGWYDHDWTPQPEIDRLTHSKLRPGATVYDCGAHQAVVALILARLVGPAGRVVAVEANGHNAAVARENLALNPDARAPIDVVHAAVSDADGTLTFDQNLNGQVAGNRRRAGRQTVPALTLNTLSHRFPLPDVVLLDIEGSEAAALTAAADLFRDGHRPDWMVEVHAGHGLEALGGTVPGVFAFFADRGYALDYCPQNQDRFLPLTPTAIATLTDRFFLAATTAPTT